MVSRYGEKITLKGEQYHYGDNGIIVFVNYNNMKKITKIKRITLESNVVTDFIPWYIHEYYHTPHHLHPSYLSGANAFKASHSSTVDASILSND